MPTAPFNDQLDRLEASLPPIPARILRLQRSLADAACERTSAVVSSVADSAKQFLDTARVSGKTVTGQARAAGDDVLTTARTGARTVAGQASAQGARVSKAASTEATSLLDSAIDAVEETVEDVETDEQPGSGTPYEQWTKAQLVERAKELDIEGRSGMSKGQLIAALRAA